ncbi:MAG: hypothetical protein ACFFCH_07095 [Promethearchaeota archaeon]
MSEETLLQEIACPKGGKPRAIKSVIRIETLPFMERTMSEKIEQEHRKLAKTDPDEFQREVHLQLAEAQAKMRKEGLVKLELRCPDHSGAGEYSFFYENLPSYAPVIKEHTLRCLKCGEPVRLENTKTSDKFKVLTIRCPAHGTGQRKISTIIHDTIMQAENTSSTPPLLTPTETKPAIIQPSAPLGGKTTISFCWNCGAKAIDSTSVYCYKCGVSLSPP